jgi:hypothetical protein
MVTAELSMVLLTKSHLVLKAKVLQYFQIIVDMMATGKKERCRVMENSVGVMDLAIKESISMAANMDKVLSYSHQKNTIKVSGCMAGRTAKGYFTTNKGIY